MCKVLSYRWKEFTIKSILRLLEPQDKEIGNSIISIVWLFYLTPNKLRPYMSRRLCSTVWLSFFQSLVFIWTLFGSRLSWRCTQFDTSVFTTVCEIVRGFRSDVLCHWLQVILVLISEVSGPLQFNKRVV